jgi:NAD(P)H dehydrogenase (quinone)
MRARYELAGDHGWTLSELAAELSKQSGKVVYQNLSEADFAAALKSVGLPAGLADMLADSDIGASKGGLFDDSHTLSKLIGRPTTRWRRASKPFCNCYKLVIFCGIPSGHL